jgi:predicted amidohydrolase
MKADKIIKNAKIFTSDKEHPMATALVVKDGKFVYVGDEAGLSAYEGEVTDLGGKFIMPGIIDSHVHITFGAGYEFADMGLRFDCEGKQGALDFMVFDQDLLTAPQEGFSYNRPGDVYISGRKMN